MGYTKARRGTMKKQYMKPVLAKAGVLSRFVAKVSDGGETQ